MEKLSALRVPDVHQLFSDGFPDGASLYLYRFQALPSMHLFPELEGSRAFLAFTKKFSPRITDAFQYHNESDRRSSSFSKAVVLLDNHCVAKFGAAYAMILHDGRNASFVEDFGALVRQFKARPRRMPLEINLVIKSDRGLDLRAMEIKRTNLDLGLFYDDDFAEVDKRIRKRLSAKNDKGIVLLHGLAGTGKTTYLRYLVGRICKKVLFLSPSVAGDLMSPDFIDLLMDNPESVLLIEDAKNIIMSRKYNANSSVSNLLNISDGLLADFLNVQIVCTFNHSLAGIDSALMRNERLITKYEFGKLSVAKARRLSSHLGFDCRIDSPMTVAEIANPHEPATPRETMEVIGFNGIR